MSAVAPAQPDGLVDALPTLAARLAAEATGTAFLVIAIVGSGIAATHAFGDGASGPALVVNAVATGVVLTALIVALHPVSAAFNPLVTLFDAFSRTITVRRAACLVAAQLTGAAIGTVVANIMFARPPVAISGARHLDGAVLLGELVATVGLLLVVATTARTGNALRVGIGVGAYITAAIWCTSSTAFANPAVTLARTLTDTFTGIAPPVAAGFVAIQTVALVAAYPLIRLLTRSIR